MSKNFLSDTAVSKSGFPTGHALVIAIAAYVDVNPLPSVIINDAREIADTLTSPAYCGYDPKNIVSLLDGDATLEAILRELESLTSRSKSDDTVFIYFSGHGASIGTPIDPVSALVPVDCDLANINKTVLLEEVFSDALARIRAQRLVVIIDACHAGGVATLKAFGHESFTHLGFNEKSLGQLAKGTGRVIIASSRESETSLILNGASNSLFTEHFLGALKGAAHTRKDGLIRVFDIFNHVSEKVSAAALGKQHPIFKASDLEDNFPVALESGGIKVVTTVMSESQAIKPLIWRKLENIFADLYPVGPQDLEVWTRSGGDISQLRLNGNGRAQWFSALKAMQQGGGGKGINQQTLLDTALQDFPHHQELKKLSDSDGNV
jgi:hypothetical protein